MRLVLAGSILAMVGCAEKSSSSVTGTVMYKGQPVTSGIINFYIPEKGIGAQGELDASGTYTLVGTLEPGVYKVYLTPPMPEQLPPGQVSKRPPFPIPPQYLDATKTTISKDVKAGKNEITIEVPG